MSENASTKGQRVEVTARCLTIYMGESDRWNGAPLYEAVVLKARELHLAGATVLRGPMGFGAASRIHTAKILRLSEDLPIVVEIIDTAEKIATFMPHLEAMLGQGLITVHDVTIVRWEPVASQTA